MEPITLASLDPKLNDIRHLRADQEFCGVIGCFGLICPTSFGTAKETLPNHNLAENMEFRCSFPNLPPIRGEFESLEPRKTLGKESEKANRPTYFDVGLHL